MARAAKPKKKPAARARPAPKAKIARTRKAAPTKRAAKTVRKSRSAATPKAAPKRRAAKPVRSRKITEAVSAPPLPESPPIEAPPAPAAIEPVTPPAPEPAPVPEPAPAKPEPPSFVPVQEPPTTTPAPGGETMPEATPVPAAPTAPPQWEAVPEPPHGTTAPAVAQAPAEDADPWVLRGTLRRGIPGLMMAGWGVALVGLAVMASSYHRSIGAARISTILGLRGDYLGAILVVLGVIAAVVFHFVPARKAYGLHLQSPKSDLEPEVRFAHGQVLLSQILTGVGLGLAALGLTVMVYYLQSSYNFGSTLESQRFGMTYLTHSIGLVPLVLGLLVMAFGLGRVDVARRARNLAVVAYHGPTAETAAAAPTSVVADEEVRNLVKRLDALMARLPDDAVSEFARSPEADTYLKLLGPSA